MGIIRAARHEADPCDQRQGDPGGGSHRALGCQAEDGEEQRGAIFPGDQAMPVRHVGDDGAQHQIARSLRQPLRHRQRQKQRQHARLHQQQPEVDRHLHQFAEYRGAMLAERHADAHPDRAGGDAEHELQKEQAARPAREPHIAGDEEHEERRAHQLPEGDGEVRRHHPDQQPVPQHGAKRDAKRGARPGGGRRPFGKGAQHQRQRDGEASDRHHAEGGELQRRVIRAELIDERWQQQHDEQRRRRRDGSERRDAGALVIAAGKFARPCEMRDLHHRQAEIEEHQRDPQPQRADRAGREEQRDPGGRIQRRAGDDPGLAPSEPAARAVAQHADHRVRHRAPQPFDQENHTQRRQRNAEILRINRRQIDGERHLRRGDGNGEGGESGEFPAVQPRLPGGGVGADDRKAGGAAGHGQNRVRKVRP